MPKTAKPISIFAVQHPTEAAICHLAAHLKMGGKSTYMLSVSL